MELENLRLLLKVVELGSVHGAARHLGIARSMLRRRLGELEAEAGCELFQASASGVALTSAGAVIAEEGRALLERSARMLAAAKAAEARPDGVLRMICPVGMPDQLHVQLVYALKASNPGLRVVERETPNPLAHLHEPFDLLLHFGPGPTHGEWFSRILRRMELVPLASQAYLDAHGRPSTPDDLGEHVLLSWRRPGTDPAAWPLRNGGAVAIEPFLVSDNPHYLHRMAQAGGGILLGHFQPTFLEAPTPLLPILDDVIAVEETFRVLTPMPANVDARVRSAVESLQGLLSSLEA